jgi:hypothetical protein
MKNLRTILTATALTLGLFTVTFTACTPDPCKNVVCDNGGTCDANGACVCPAGFEGTTCATLSRDKFIGIFNGSETCTIGTDTYAVTTTPNSDKTKFNIQNLYNQSTITAIANANGNAFTIPSQTVAANVVGSGSGTITGNNITITYTVTTGTGATAISNTCTFTGVK